MLIKFSGGRASAGRAAAYLTGELDSQGEEREAVIVLRGDPELVAAVADGLEFAHTYTSGVLAWAPEDQPTAAHISAVLDEFEATAWAGLETDRYAWTAVQHDEPAGGVHVHILAARVDLETGKSLNIAPPGWERDYDPLRDWQNAEHGWARPDDPERQRDLEPGYSAYEDAAALRQGLASEHPRQELHDYLTAAVERGVIEDRAGIVAALTEAGFSVPREGEHYITAADPESGAKWRLKGGIYEREFHAAELESESPGADDRAAGSDRGVERGRAEGAERELASRRAIRAEYNRERYGESLRSLEADLSPDLEAGAALLSGVGRGRDLGLGGDRHSVGLADRERAGGVRQDHGRHRGPAADLAPDRAEDLGREISGGGGRAAVAAAAARQQGAAIQHGRGRGLGRVAAEEVSAEAIYERAGDAVVDRVRAISETIRDTDAAIRDTDAALRGAESAAQRAGRGLNEAGRRLDGASRGVGGAHESVTEASAALKQQAQKERKLEAEKGFGLGD